MTVGSLATHTTAQSAERSSLPFQEVLGPPSMHCYPSILAPQHGKDLRRLPAASACVRRQLRAGERRAPATAIERCHLTPGTPQITPCASMWGAMKSQHGGRCKAVWIGCGGHAPQRVGGRRGRAGRAHLLRRGLRPAPGRARCPRKGNWPPPWPSLRGDRRPFAETDRLRLTALSSPPPFLHI